MISIKPSSNDNDSDLVRLGANLAGWRGLTTLSQEAVAQHVARSVPGFTRAHLNAIEHGQRWPCPDELRDLHRLSTRRRPGRQPPGAAF